MRGDTRASLRLLFPQWQGTPAGVLHDRLPDLAVEQVLDGQRLGGRLLQVLAPESTTPTAEVPVATSRNGLAVSDGIYARDAVLTQLQAALQIVAERDPRRILTLGGDCSVSIAPFAHLAGVYGDDLAVIWLDANPDLTTPGDVYTGFHAMAAATLLGVGDADATRALPALLEPHQMLVVGQRGADDEAVARQRELGIASLGPADVAQDSSAVLAWLRASGASRVAIHVCLDVLAAGELDGAARGAAPVGGAAAAHGLRLAELVRIIGDVAEPVTVVGVTIADHLPRVEILLRDFLRRLPLR